MYTFSILQEVLVSLSHEGCNKATKGSEKGDKMALIQRTAI